jgi:hypothetical protein
MAGGRSNLERIKLVECGKNMVKSRTDDGEWRREGEVYLAPLTFRSPGFKLRLEIKEKEIRYSTELQRASIYHIVC